MNLCYICYEYKIKQKNISRCLNTECDVFTCDECLEEWYKEKKECPICHTTIGDIQNNNLHELELDNDIIEDTEDIEDIQIIQVNRGINCYHIENETKKIMKEALLAYIKYSLVFLLIGFIGYNIIYLIELHSFQKVIQKTKENYVNIDFYVYLIMLGITFIGGLLVTLGCCITLGKICSLDS